MFIRKAAGEYEVRVGVVDPVLAELAVLRSSVDQRAAIVVGNSRRLERVAEESRQLTSSAGPSSRTAVMRRASGIARLAILAP